MKARDVLEDGSNPTALGYIKGRFSRIIPFKEFYVLGVVKVEDGMILFLKRS